MPSQNEYNVTLQRQRVQDIKINVLNFNMDILDDLSNVTLSCSINEDANSDIRRTASITITVKDKSYNVDVGSRIWLDRYIQIFTGVESIITREMVWTNQGMFLINRPTVNYNAIENTLSFEALDLMSKLTGIRNGQLEGIPTLIPMGSNIRTTIISTIALGGFTKYLIDENPISVPYDIKVEQGGTIYDILNKIKEINPLYEMYFDVNGVFHYNLIPDGREDGIVADDNLLQNVLISYTLPTDFTNVKNYIEVYGKSIVPSYFGGTATVSGNQYSISISGISSLSENLIYGFVAPSIVINPYLKVNSLTAYPVVNSNGTPAIIPKSDEYYIVRFKNNRFEFMGYQQPRAVAVNTNPDSPFCVKTDKDIIRLVLFGGEFDNIWSNELAQESANYYLYLHSNMADSITLNVAPISWLTVNTLVEFTIPTETTPKLWLIKTISTEYSTTGTQAINMIRVYPSYPNP